MNAHPIPEVARLDEHVRLLVPVLDVEYGDAPNRLPYRLMEMYRTTLVAARGIPAIDATAAWAHAHVDYELPESLYGQLDHAKGSLREHKTTAAQEALHRANGIIVTEVPSGLSLPGMARVAALSSTLVTIAELVNVGMSCDFGHEPANVWSLIEEPTHIRLAEAVVNTMRGFRPRSLFEIDPDLVRDEIRRWPPNDHAGLLILLWVVTNGALQEFAPEVERERRSYEQLGAILQEP